MTGSALQNAMLALNETVRVAQQNGDDTILQHALSQLCRLLSQYPAAAKEGLESMDRHEQFSQLFRLLQRQAHLSQLAIARLGYAA